MKVFCDSPSFWPPPWFGFGPQARVIPPLYIQEIRAGGRGLRLKLQTGPGPMIWLLGLWEETPGNVLPVQLLIRPTCRNWMPTWIANAGQGPGCAAGMICSGQPCSPVFRFGSQVSSTFFQSVSARNLTGSMAQADAEFSVMIPVGTSITFNA